MAFAVLAMAAGCVSPVLAAATETSTAETSGFHDS
jgi:hypothetical protein